MKTACKKEPIVFESAECLALKIRNKSLSSVELAKAYIAQIEQVNPLINAIKEVDHDRILQDAQRLDQELHKGQLRGPLHGVPITIKDNLLTQGIITTGGSFAFANNIPTQDATVVQRLRHAGAIILGKTNLPDFALSWETNSTAFGRTNNPYDLNRTAGGSSGGEAAIIAAGGSALGIGTDSGGSIRLPAHYCGIAGLRTSRGLIPSTGHMPPTEGYPVLGVFANFNSIGPMARYVSDLIYTLPILMGNDGIDPYAEIKPLKKPLHFQIKGLKIALYTSINDQSIDPEIEISLRNVARVLSDQGAIISEITPPALNDARDIYCAIVGADGGKAIRALLKELGYEKPPHEIKSVLNLMTKRPGLAKLLDAWIQWDLFRMKLLQFMQPFDLILCPTAAFTALSHGESLIDPPHFEREHYLIPYSLMGWPCVVVPAGQSSTGLPIGIQLIGKHRQDYKVLYTALAIEKEGLNTVVAPYSHSIVAGGFPDMS